jgi:FkbM family methyltransferase
VNVERARLRARMLWRHGVQRRLHGIDALERRLSWPLWRWLCGVNAAAYVRALSRRGLTGFFVQIGSNDGMRYDPLHETVKDRGWSGLLVEPLPAVYERLRANYAGTADISFANVAVSDDEGLTTMYTVEPRPSDPDWAGLIASLDRSTVLQHANVLPDLDERIRPVQIESVRLSTLLERHGVDHIDLLHIDAEGVDDLILQQIDPAAPWAPSYVIFETKHLTGGRYGRAKARLRRDGYRVVNLWPDAFAYRSRPW